MPLFGLVAILVLKGARMVFPTSSRFLLQDYIMAMLGVLMLALFTEALQSLSATRQAELSDILLDLVGATCGLALFFTYDQQVSRKWAQWRQFPRKAILRFCVLLLLGAMLQPVVIWAYAYWDRASRFPSLLQFSSDWEMKFVQASDSELQVVAPPEGWKQSAKNKVGQLVFHPKTYPGIRIDEPYSDWRGYTFFQLDIFSELPNSQSIAIRIDDLHHNNEYSDRFNKAITISPGLNQIQIPLDAIRQSPVGRELDMSAIRMVLLFAVNPPEEFTLYLDNIRLE